MNKTFTTTIANTPNAARTQQLNSFMSSPLAQNAFGDASKAYSGDAKSAMMGSPQNYQNDYSKYQAGQFADHLGSLGWTPDKSSVDRTEFDQTMASQGIKPGSSEYMNRWGNYSNAAGQAGMFGGISGGSGGASSIGGVSAVNPQAGQANELDAFKRYEDMAFNNAMARLEPQFDRQNADFNQGMVSRGLPVGSDAYNSSQANLAQAQAGATNDAALGAMQFGLGAQNQSFQQDATRSGLANALLQSKWSSDLGWANNALGNRQLTQQGQQFNDKLGFDYDTFFDTLGQRNYEFDSTMGQRNYEFDSTMDQNYWDRGNYWDFAYDRANSDDMFRADDSNYRNNAYMDNLFLSLFGQPAPGVQGQNAGGMYGQQIGNAQRPGFDLLYGLGFL